jgi:hypothetical protein
LDFKEVGCKRVDWIDLVQDETKWRAGSCAKGYELLGYKKWGEAFGYLKSYQIFQDGLCTMDLFTP